MHGFLNTPLISLLTICVSISIGNPPYKSQTVHNFEINFYAIYLIMSLILRYNHFFQDLFNKKVFLQNQVKNTLPIKIQDFKSINLWPQLGSGEKMQFIYDIWIITNKVGLKQPQKGLSILAVYSPVCTPGHFFWANQDQTWWTHPHIDGSTFGSSDMLISVPIFPWKSYLP